MSSGWARRMCQFGAVAGMVSSGYSMNGLDLEICYPTLAAKCASRMGHPNTVAFAKSAK